MNFQIYNLHTDLFSRSIAVLQLQRGSEEWNNPIICLIAALRYITNKKTKRSEEVSSICKRNEGCSCLASKILVNRKPAQERPLKLIQKSREMCPVSVKKGTISIECFDSGIQFFRCLIFGFVYYCELLALVRVF